MSKKPDISGLETVHTYWDSSNGFLCPLCNNPLEYAYNDGGRLLVTLEKPLWIVSNYYRCLNKECNLHKAFPVLHNNAIPNRKFGKDVWEKVITFHFKRHLDYEQIMGVIWDVYHIEISKNAVRDICLYYKVAGKLFVTDETKKLLEKNGEIILSLDGAQPEKGKSALWIFSDRITKRVLHSELLVTAAEPVLVEKMEYLEKTYNVPIKGVISDKQKNIVNAVKNFNPEIPHAFCQFHFLNHIMEPIISKDSHIATQLKKRVRKLSIVVNQYKGNLKQSNSQFNALYKDFFPLAQELLNAISVKQKRWKKFKGIEIYKNIEYVYNQIAKITDTKSQKVQNSLDLIKKNLKNWLEEFKAISEEISSLIKDTKDLRKILYYDQFKSRTIKKKVRSWVYKIQQRLKRQNKEYRPENLKYVKMNYKTSCNTIWQQWIRLENSYSSGLYFSYDSAQIEKTNNPKELLINRTKSHFRRWLGKSNISELFQRHSEEYCFLVEHGIEQKDIEEVLLRYSVAYINGHLSEHQSVQAVIKRKSNIREENTGNLKKFEENICN